MTGIPLSRTLSSRIRAQIERDYAALEYLPWQSLDELRQMLFRSSGAVEVIDQEEDVYALSHCRRPLGV